MSLTEKILAGLALWTLASFLIAPVIGRWIRDANQWHDDNGGTL